jgi:hypothetical protein
MIGVKKRFDVNALQAVVTWTVATLALPVSSAFAEPNVLASRLSPIHLEAAVTNSENITASAARPGSKATVVPSRIHAKAKSAQPAAPAMRIEIKEAARHVVRSDQAARQRLAGFGADSAITPNVLQNLREKSAPSPITMGDRPARSLGLCGDGKPWRFAELDGKTVAGLLPEFNALRPRTVCAKRGVVIADYAFK